MSGSLWTFNAKDGYCEALVRGLRQSLLTPDEYRRLGLADTIEDLRTALEETDYGTFLQDEPTPIAVTTIGARCREKFAAEFRHLRSCAGQPLVKFLDFIVAEKMIDNVINLIQGAVNKKNVDEMFARIDPLGWFPEMRGIAAAVESSNGGYDEVYRTLLIESPVGGYFEQYLNEKALEEMHTNGPNPEGVEGLLTEQDLELMRSALKKAWLEAFYEFCDSLGSVTASVMGNILKTEADFRVLSVTLNSLRSQLGQAARLPERNSLYPAFGYLYPDGTDKVRKAWNDATVRSALEGFPNYSALFEECKQFYARDAETPETTVNRPAAGTAKSLEDVLFKESVKMCELAFEEQFHYGVFYAWAKLKEQEIRNIVWIADMILMNRKEHIDQILPIFASRI